MTDVLKTFTAVAQWLTTSPKAAATMIGWTVEERDALIQRLLDRDAYLLDAIGGTDTFRVTPIGEFQIKGTNRTGAASVVGQLLVPDQSADVDGTVYATAATITGATASNTTAGRLYLSIAVTGGKGTALFFSDAALTTQVAHAQLANNLGGTAALVADGASGLGGTITLTAACPAVAEETGTIDMGVTAGYSLAPAGSSAVVAICGESVAANAEMWITIPGGTAQVLIETGDSISRGQYVRSTLTGGAAGAAQGDDAMLSSRESTYIGRAIGRLDGSGPGTTCGILFNPSLALPGVVRVIGGFAFASLAGLAGGVKTYDVALVTPPTNARLLGCVIGEGAAFDLFNNGAGASYGLEIGVAADHDLLTTSTDIAVATGNTNPKTGLSGIAGFPMKNIGGQALRLWLTSSADLKNTTVGQVQVDLFYEVVS